MEMDDKLLMIPGPTGLPPEVREALSRPMIGHRSAEFGDLLKQCTPLLQGLYCTCADVLVLTASGTGAMEAGIVSTLSPGDKVLAVSVGHFGERLGKIAELFGADVTWLRSEWGQAADPEEVAAALDADDYSALLFTQNETSTGITNPVREIAAVARERGVLTIVDAISGLGAVELRTDEWGLDVVAAGSQKAMMLPPGLAFVSMSQAAWKRAETAKMPKYYWDLIKARKSLHEKWQTPYTPNVSMLFALEVALRMLHEEGISAVWARHARWAQMVREGVQGLGLQLFADQRFASNVVTSFLPPDGVEAGRITKRMWDEHGVLITGGQGKLRGKIVRIGHLGTINQEQVQRTLKALKAAL